jgi:hypothetical protein
MSAVSKEPCARVRQALQEHYDALPPQAVEEAGYRSTEGGQSAARHRLPREVEQHLSSCRACAAFAGSLEEIRVGLRGVLDARLAGLGPPRIDELLKRQSLRIDRQPKRWRRLRWIALPAAAVLVAAVLSPILTRQLQTRRLVRREIAAFVDDFVDELYAEPLLEGVEAPVHGGSDDFEMLNRAGGDIERWLGGEEPPGAVLN